MRAEPGTRLRPMGLNQRIRGQTTVLDVGQALQNILAREKNVEIRIRCHGKKNRYANAEIAI